MVKGMIHGQKTDQREKLHCDLAEEDSGICDGHWNGHLKEAIDEEEATH